MKKGKIIFETLAQITKPTGQMKHMEKYKSAEDVALAMQKLKKAAPDLLEALQSILDFPKDDLKEWRKEGFTTITLDYKLIDQALKAIEKTK